MSDENTNVTEQTAEAPAAEKVKKVRNTEPKRVYLGHKWAAPGTTFGEIKRIVASYGSEGVMTDVVTERMLAEFKPKKSNNYDKHFVQAYLRDCPKFGYLTYDAGEQAADLGTAPEPKTTKKAASTDGAASLTKAGQEFLNALKTFVGEEKHASGEYNVSLKDIAEDVKKPIKAFARVMTKLEKDGFITVTTSGEESLVKFTEAGWNSAAEPVAEAQG